MIFRTIFKYIYFITIATIVSGTNFKHETNSNFKRSKGLQDPMADLTHYPGLQYMPNRNTKRMTMDDNARTRGAWGQMNPQYYQNPLPQYQNQYYQNMQGANNQYYTSTEYPTSTGGSVINLYKQLDGKNPTVTQQRIKGHSPISAPVKSDQRGVSSYGNEYNEQRAAESSGGGRFDEQKNPKKVKVLICKLHQGQN